MRLTKNQAQALYDVAASSTRVNLHELGRTGVSLIRKGLLEKDWHRNDASGERVVLTDAGKKVSSKLGWL